MKLKALITSLVLGSSSLAVASPLSFSAEASWGGGTAPAVRDHRAQPPLVVPQWRAVDQYRPVVAPRNGGPRYEPVRPGWHMPNVLLADSVKFNSGETRKFVELESNPRRYNALTIQVSDAPFLLKQVRINFADGTYQLVRNIGVTLASGGAYVLELDGSGRQVAGLVVYGENTGRSRATAINIFGR